MPERNGVGNLLVKSLNGIGVFAMIGVVILATIKWGAIETMRASVNDLVLQSETSRKERDETASQVRQLASDVQKHCTAQEKRENIQDIASTVRWKEQVETDRSQDKVTQMMNEAIIRIDMTTLSIQSNVSEIKQLLRANP